MDVRRWSAMFIGGDVRYRPPVSKSAHTQSGEPGLQEVVPAACAVGYYLGRNTHL